MQNTVGSRAESQNIFAWIYKFARGEFFLPQFVYGGVIFGKKAFYVYVAHTETQRHRLAFIVVFATHMKFATGKHGQKRVARSVHEIIGKYSFFAKRTAHGYVSYSALVVKYVFQRGMKQNIDAVIIGHVVKYDF